VGATNYLCGVGFLLSRRWVLFAVAVVLMAWGAWALGQWQFHRLHERKHDNRVTAVNLNAAPAPVDDVLSTRRATSADDEWRRVTVHGTWDDKHTIVLKYQTRDSAAGVDVVTPLVTSGGAAVLVDRGWLGTENSGATRPKLPPVTSGQVTVTGWVRRDATGGATRVSDLSTRAVSSARIAAVVPYPLYRGFLDLAAESPAPAKPLAAVELPDDTSNGPHFFYGLQWWFFGALAIFGFCYLAWDELRQARRRRAAEPVSERPEHAAVHGQHRPGDEG
jgi:cytochrome oxidase assembly protein ShyY1